MYVIIIEDHCYHFAVDSNCFRAFVSQNQSQLNSFVTPCKHYCMQLTTAFLAVMSCNQFINTAMYLPKVGFNLMYEMLYAL